LGAPTRIKSRRIFEVDPLLCPQCGVEMKRVAVIQDVGVVDRILAHLRRIGGNDPWEGTAQRGPPAGVPGSADTHGSSVVTGETERCADTTEEVSKGRSEETRLEKMPRLQRSLDG